MTSTLPGRPADLSTAAGSRHVYDITFAGSDPEALLRVLATLRRRRCIISHVAFDAADGDRPGRLTVGIEPPSMRRDVVAAWLGRLVDVAAVRARR